MYQYRIYLLGFLFLTSCYYTAFYVMSPHSIEQFKKRIEVAKNDKTLPELDQKLCNETSVAIIGKILEKPKENDSK